MDFWMGAVDTGRKYQRATEPEALYEVVTEKSGQRHKKTTNWHEIISR